MIVYFLIFLLLAVIVAVLSYVTNQFYKRAKRRYWELYQKIMDLRQQSDQLLLQVEQIQKRGDHIREQVDQVQQQIDKVREELGELIREQVEQVKQHQLLEHIADVAARAREIELISPDNYDKSLQLLHEMEMDNFQGKTFPDKKKEALE